MPLEVEKIVNKYFEHRVQVPEYSRDLVDYPVPRVQEVQVPVVCEVHEPVETVREDSTRSETCRRTSTCSAM